MFAMWGVVLVACGVAAGLGYGLSDLMGASGDRAAALAAGGLLAMLTNSLMPYAFDRGRGPGRGVHGGWLRRHHGVVLTRRSVPL